MAYLEQLLSHILCEGGGKGESRKKKINNNPFSLSLSLSYLPGLEKKKGNFHLPDTYSHTPVFAVVITYYCRYMPLPNHQGWHAKRKLSRNTYTLHTCFSHVLAPICMLSRWLVTKSLRRSSGGSLLRVYCLVGWARVQWASALVPDQTCPFV